jgi:transposase InsO family protein
MYPCVIKVNQNNIDNALINRQEIQQGVFLVDSIVKVVNDRTHAYLINTTEKDVNIETPTINVEPVLINTSPRDSSTYIINSITSNNLVNRLKILRENLRLDHLNKEEKLSIIPIIENYNDIFHLPGDKLKGTNKITHSIPTTDNLPVVVKQYRYPPVHKEEIKKQTSKLLEQDIIQPSLSPFNSPLWVVPKKPDTDGKKRWRLVIDFRKLNDKTNADAYPLPNIADILDQLGKAKYFSCFDLASGFHQIPMNPQDSMKTAFSTPNGHYEYKKMPFGLKNAPATFQRLMDNVLTGLQGNVCFVYLDDIVIYADSLEEHKQKLNQLFQRLREAGLSLQTDKCEFFKKELMYLGHIISDKGVKPNPEKVKAVKLYPIPKNHKELRQFLGLVGYYRRFIKDFSSITQPFTSLFRKNASFKWEMQQQINFEKIKVLLSNEPILQYPDFDKEFILTTDASDEGIGAVLSQGRIGNDLPVAYASRTLNKAERNYNTTEKELLAIVWATKHFRPYLYGKRFKIVTDHKPLTWLFNVKDPSSRLMRWRLKLEEYDYEVLYKEGRQNTNADALSRTPQISVLQVQASTSDNKNPSYSLFLQHALNDALWKTDNIIPQISGNIKGLLVKETHASPKIKITLSKKNGNKTEDLTLTPGNIKITKGKHPIEVNLITRKEGNSTAEMEDIFNCLIKLKRYVISNNHTVISIAPIGDVTNKIKINQMIKYIFKDTPIKVHILESLIQEITDSAIKQDILRELHNSIIGGHKGITKTLKRVQQYYSWSGMKQDVKRYIKTCHDCQKRKLVREKTKAPMLITDTPNEAFEKVAIDIVGPLPETEKGHKYILTTQDLLTKFCTAYPLLDTNSTTIADTIINKYIYTFGSPKELLSDQGSNISGELMKAVAKIFKIKQVKTSVYHPQSNGALERSHHVLAEYLKPYINQNQNNWDSFLDAAMFSYNTAYHEGTKISPYELVFGRRPRLPSTLIEPRQGITHKDFLVDLTNKLNYLKKNARDNLIKAKESAKKHYDKKIKPLVLDPGDYVYVLHETVRAGSKKLTDQYDGPFQITRKLSDVNYEIKRGNRSQVLHVNKLKRAYFPLQNVDSDDSNN